MTYLDDIIAKAKADLLKVADAYLLGDPTCRGDRTLSSRVFNDGKKLGAIRAGTAGITPERISVALDWLETNWKDGMVWPAEVERPSLQRKKLAEAAQ